MTKEEVLKQLPYEAPFLFVDELTHLDEDSVSGSYTFDKELDFYKGHFKDNPVTPGVILTETMAQIGLVSLGLYLSSDTETNNSSHVMLTSTAIDFLKPVFPGEKVTVTCEKVFFRLKKLLHCKVEMRNEKDEIVCKGTISGLVTAVLKD